MDKYTEFMKVCKTITFNLISTSIRNKLILLKLAKLLFSSIVLRCFTKYFPVSVQEVSLYNQIYC